MAEKNNVFPAPGIWEEMVTVNDQKSLASLADSQPVMLIFLRFFGCSFCREAISDIARKRKKIEDRGIRIVMVHMSPSQDLAEKFFRRYKLFPIDHIADPERTYYKSFGLVRGTPQQLFGLMSWMRGFQASVLEGHGATLPGGELGDDFQMPGVFVVHKGEIKNSFIHRYPYDRPDYEEICQID